MHRYVIFDVETTGLSPGNGDRVIEIGAVAIEDKSIVESEQAGKRRAGYYVTYQDILQTVSGKSKSRKFQTPSGKSQPHNSQTPSAELTVQAISERFPLPWSVYVRLLSLPCSLTRS